MISTMQEMTSSRAVLFPDGFHALKAVRTLTPHLFVLDYKLPGMDGIELYDQLQEIPELEQIPVGSGGFGGWSPVKSATMISSRCFMAAPLTAHRSLPVVTALAPVSPASQGAAPSHPGAFRCAPTAL
jgi:CheY-like chemotaxis protein